MLETTQAVPADHLGFAYLLHEALTRPGIISEAYRAFRGKDPGIEALMKKRGFPVPAATAAASGKQ